MAVVVLITITYESTCTGNVNSMLDLPLGPRLEGNNLTDTFTDTGIRIARRRPTIS